MAAEAIAQGNGCFVDDDFDGAVDCYSKALQEEPSAVAYAARAKAQIKLEKYLEAAEDGGKAIELDPTNAQGYLQKGEACFHLEEYETARECFTKGLELAPNNAKFKTWIRKCDAEIEDEAATSPAAASKPAAAPKPAPAAAPAQPATPSPEPAAPAPVPAPAAAQAPLAPAAAPAQEGKYRHQHYQIQDKVVVDVYAKALKPEQVNVEFQPRSLRVMIRDAEGQVEYELEKQLYADISPEGSRFEVLRSKVEIAMKKADANRAWPTLEPSNVAAAANYSQPMSPPGGQYPSSYTKAPKDWSKVEAEVKQMEEKGELDEGDPLNNFFKKIFAGGDEDTRRAMMKSFVESNGTVLSTNWSEVGSKKVEYTPSDKAELKKL